MQPQNPHRGIAGLEGKQPIGAAVTIGIKDPKKGFPIQKDRFHIVMPEADVNDRREHHPLFKPFNHAPPGKRQIVYAELVHSTIAECFDYKLRAQNAKGHPSHPAKVPLCIGDGNRARRYQGEKGGEHVFEDIACPHDRCPLRQGQRPECKPWMRLLFRLRWKSADTGMPEPLVKYTSASWNTVRSFVGFFEHIESAASALGLDRYSLAGFPLMLTLAEKKSAARQSRFPVVTVAPLVEVSAFLKRQVEFRRELADLRAVERPAITQAPAVALTDREERANEDRDFAAHHPSRPSDEGGEE